MDVFPASLMAFMTHRPSGGPPTPVTMTSTTITLIFVFLALAFLIARCSAARREASVGPDWRVIKYAIGWAGSPLGASGPSSGEAPRWSGGGVDGEPGFGSVGAAGELRTGDTSGKLGNIGRDASTWGAAGRTAACVGGCDTDGEATIGAAEPSRGESEAAETLGGGGCGCGWGGPPGGGLPEPSRGASPSSVTTEGVCAGAVGGSMATVALSRACSLMFGVSVPRRYDLSWNSIASESASQSSAGLALRGWHDGVMSNAENSVKTRLQADLTTAMKARDELVLSTIRMVRAAIMNAEVAGSEAVELSEEEAIAVLRSEAKKRAESAEVYEQNGRLESAAKERAELEVIERYLPAAMSDDQLAAIVDDEVAAAAATGAEGGRAMGLVIKAVRERAGDGADGGRIAALVKARLGL